MFAVSGWAEDTKSEPYSVELVNRAKAFLDKAAVKWWTRLAEQGYADAQCNLGNCYYLGRGVTQDNKKAVGWYMKSAEQGDVGAQNHLVWCYAKGEGVTQDYKEAVFWLTKATEHGNAMAKEALEKMKSK